MLRGRHQRQIKRRLDQIYEGFRALYIIYIYIEGIYAEYIGIMEKEKEGTIEGLEFKGLGIIPLK